MCGHNSNALVPNFIKIAYSDPKLSKKIIFKLWHPLQTTQLNIQVVSKVMSQQKRVKKKWNQLSHC